MLKTTQLPTLLALPNWAFTSAQECQQTVLLLTCACQDRNGPSASRWACDSQNRFSLALEMTRIHPNFLSASGVIIVRKIRTVKTPLAGVFARHGMLQFSAQAAANKFAG
jgi:hypothetical protein